jgi:hypothetical protein
VLRGWLDLITTRPANEIAATLRASRSSRTSPRRPSSKKG